MKGFMWNSSSVFGYFPTALLDLFAASRAQRFRRHFPVGIALSAMAAMKGSTQDLSFGVPDTAPRLTDLSAREISITLFMIYTVSFFEGNLVCKNWLALISRE